MSNQTEFQTGDVVEIVGPEPCSLYVSGSVGTIKNKLTVFGRTVYTVAFPDESEAYKMGCELRPA